MIEIFGYDFLTRALAVGAFTAVTTAVLGNFVVAARQSVASDMLAHTALGGVGLGIFLGISPNLAAIATVILGSILLWYLQRQRQFPPEAVSMLLMAGGLAFAILFAHLAKGNPISFETFLFGSILTVTPREAIFFSGLNILVLAVLFLFWNRFLAMIFGPYASLGVSRKGIIFEFVFLLLLGIVVAASLKTIGGLLVGAMLVIPALAARNIAGSFRSTAFGGVVINLSGTVGGILASFYLDIPAGSGIVLLLILLFIILFLWRKAYHPISS